MLFRIFVGDEQRDISTGKELTVVETSLQDDLLGIPGVEGAEVDGSHDAPAGLRIRIAEDADQQAVGGAIRRVLSSHGLGTDTRLPGEPTPDSESQKEPGSVALLTAEADESAPAHEVAEDEGRAIIDLTDKEPEVAEPAPVATSEGEGRIVAPVSPEPAESHGLPSFVEQRDERAESQAVAPTLPKVSPAGVARLERVTVDEGRSGIVVTVSSSDGHEISKVASSSEGGVEAAVIKATASLMDSSSPDPIVVNIDDRRVEGVDIVMIVLDIDGELRAGSAIVAAGRAFALGRATWAALAL
ncbi:MAG: hypothetical protein DRJ28_04415 [Actinobacteria bacterium]|nr:MAG: hypothetical protein DRJ28_04415 [Actinomycetota bacterium]